MEDRVRIQNVGLSTVLLGQGVPFIHAGSDLLRSKSLDRDSFNSGDWFNKLDFTYESNNFGVGLPVAGKNQENWPIMQPFLADTDLQPTNADIVQSAALFQELLAIRYSSPLFRLETAAEVQERVVFHNTGPSQLPGVIVMSIADGDGSNSLVDLDGLHNFIVVVINANDEGQVFTDASLAGMGLVLHPVQQSSVDDVVKTSAYDWTSGTFTVPGRTAAVFILETSPEERLENLIDEVWGLYMDGTLDKRQTIALLPKLLRASKLIGIGRIDLATNQLIAFVNQIQIFIEQGTLSPEIGGNLIHQAEAIIAQINRVAEASPIRQTIPFEK